MDAEAFVHWRVDGTLTRPHGQIERNASWWTNWPSMARPRCVKPSAEEQGPCRPLRRRSLKEQVGDEIVDVDPLFLDTCILGLSSSPRRRR